jgi:hypothetical protein
MSTRVFGGFLRIKVVRGNHRTSRIYSDNAVEIRYQHRSSRALCVDHERLLLSLPMHLDFFGYMFQIFEIESGTLRGQFFCQLWTKLDICDVISRIGRLFMRIYISYISL